MIDLNISLNSEEIEDTQKGKILIFSLGNEFYGIEIKYVIEIISLQPITEIPELPEYMRGIINLRGKIIPVMDVRLRFNKPFISYSDRTCVIVIEIEDFTMGLIVDSVSEVIYVSEEAIVSPPEVKREDNKFVKRIIKVGQEVKLLLACEALVNIKGE